MVIESEDHLSWWLTPEDVEFINRGITLVRGFAPWKTLDEREALSEWYLLGIPLTDHELVAMVNYPDYREAVTDWAKNRQRFKRFRQHYADYATIKTEMEWDVLYGRFQEEAWDREGWLAE